MKINHLSSVFVNRAGLLISASAMVVVATGCVQTAPKVGSSEAKTVATGSAGGATAEGASAQLEKCSAPLGTLAVVEDQNADWYRILTTQRGLTSTVPVLRMMIQQSNCFVVVDRGRAMNNMQQERALQNSGELRSNSNFGKGQMVSADYSITPEIVFSQKGTGGVGGGLAGLSRGLGVVGAIAGGIRTNEASTMLLLTDNRSGVQVGASEGSSSNTDFNIGGALFGSSAGGSLGAYSNTPQGKVIVAAFMDAYNGLVKAARNYKPQSVPGQSLGTGGRLSVDGAAPPAPAAAPASAAPAVMSMSQAQARLNQLGYDAGTADGQLGAKTVQALNRFQRDRRIPVTGRLDAATSSELQK
jgi:hypothetical protein